MIVRVRSNDWPSICGVFTSDDFRRGRFSFTLNFFLPCFLTQKYQMRIPIMLNAAIDPITDPATTPGCFAGVSPAALEAVADADFV